MNDLRILYWNSNGIKSKTNELHALMLKTNVDIVLLNETKLKLLNQLKLRNYNVYRSDNTSSLRGHVCGGTATLVHRRIVAQTNYHTDDNFVNHRQNIHGQLPNTNLHRLQEPKSTNENR